MFRKFKLTSSEVAVNERGMALLLVLVLLLLGSLLIVPLLGFVVTGLKSGQVYQNKTGDLFAADAGIQDATWYIKYGYLYSLPVSPAYNAFDFSTAWDYSLSPQVNNKNVNVTLNNVWVPSNIALPSQAQSSTIITTEKLVVTGSANVTTAKITLTYSPGAGEDLRVETMGVWLPRGFTYTAGSSNLEANPMADYYSIPTVQAHQGSQAVLWTFSAVPFTSFPGADSHQFPITSEITFNFTSSQPGANPNIVAWTTTSGVDDIPFSWDADTSVYRVSSLAGETIVDAYTFKQEIRHLRSAVPGDYVATGNSLMIDTDHDYAGVRDQLLTSSDATVSSIPSDATVGAAYLYWSAWLSDSRVVTVLSDDCSNFGNWISGSTWNINSGHFRSHYSSGADDTRYNTLKFSQNLSPYPAGTVKVSWDQWVSTLADVFSDSCSNFNNWNNGAAWSVNSNYFRAHYSSGDSTTRLLALKNNQNLSGYTGSTVKVSWDQWVTPLPDIFSDSCSNFNNWNNGSAWAIYNNRFRGRYSSGDNTTRLVTLKNSQNLSAYSGGTVKVSWDQWVSSGTASASDGLDFAFSADGGTTWSSNITAFRGDIGGSAVNFSYSIPSQYLTSTFKMRFALAGFGGSGPYGNVDNIKITPSYSATDGLDFAFSADGGSTWSSNITAFRGDIGGSAVNHSYSIPSQYLTSTFKMRFALAGMSDSGKYADIDNIKITPAYDNADGLDFGFSADGGVTWSNNIQAFRGDIGGSAVDFSYTVPYQYLTSGFKIRLYVVGMSGTGEYANVDNFKIVAMPADTSVTFRINGDQVYFDGQGQPAQGAQPVTADRSQVFANAAGIGGFSYSCYKDVTALVREYSTKAPDPAVNHPGNAIYTVGDVLGDTGTQLSYAGWSLIIVYSSGSSWGHQLYLFDKFTYNPGDTDADFDNDGLPGGHISGFIVPDQIPGELNAAGLTVFVGEGDDCYDGDFIAFNAPASYQTHPQDIPNSYKLWDGTYSTAVPNSNTPSSPNNVWNGKSLGLTADGVDIDTFNITWASGLLQPRDTSARIDIYTQTDNWNLIYIIISFRSSVTTGNALSYLIR